MKIAITVGLSLFLAPGLMAGGDRTKGKVVDTSLTMLRKTPEAFTNVWVRFPVQFVSLGRVENPFFTQFVPQSFANFYVWADEQPIWEKQQYDARFGLMFISKTNERLQKIYNMKTYQRMLVTGIVRNTFQDEPWIEVMSFDVLSAAQNTTTLGHMYRGQSLMQKRQWQRAISELSLAPQDNLPGHVTAQIHKDLAMCYLRLGESATAVTHLDTAVSYARDTDRELNHMSSLARAQPESFLDRTVNAQLEDHERPMWEAFADSSEDGDSSAAPSRR